MKLWSRVERTLRDLFRKPQVESQLDDEVPACVDLTTDEQIAVGPSSSEARRAALAEYGGIEQARQAVRDRRAATGVEALWQDTSFGIRQLVRHPGFNSQSVLTMEMSLTGDRYGKTAGVAQISRDGLERINTLPGIEASAAAFWLPIDVVDALPFQIIGSPADKGPEFGR
jgi:hypothetical protein